MRSGKFYVGPPHIKLEFGRNVSGWHCNPVFISMPKFYSIFSLLFDFKVSKIYDGHFITTHRSRMSIYDPTPTIQECSKETSTRSQRRPQKQLSHSPSEVTPGFQFLSSCVHSVCAYRAGPGPGLARASPSALKFSFLKQNSVVKAPVYI